MCLDTDPQCVGWRKYCCQATTYGKPCKTSDDCTDGGACWAGVCACKVLLLKDPISYLRHITPIHLVAVILALSLTPNLNQESALIALAMTYCMQYVVSSIRAHVFLIGLPSCVHLA